MTEPERPEVSPGGAAQVALAQANQALKELLPHIPRDGAEMEAFIQVIVRLGIVVSAGYYFLESCNAVGAEIPGGVECHVALGTSLLHLPYAEIWQACQLFEDFLDRLAAQQQEKPHAPPE